jgi:predicted MPP superfamily phosphohydrolase
MFKLFFIIFTLLVDTYVFIALLGMVKEHSLWFRLSFILLFCSVTVAFVILFLTMPRFDTGERDPSGLTGVFLLIGIYALVYLPKLVFLGFRVTEDVVWVISWLSRFPAGWIAGITFSPLRWSILSKAGLVLSVIPFVAILWGLVFGRFHYQVEKVDAVYPGLPAAFEGLRIVQLSDLHLGSVYGKQERVRKAIEIVNSLDPDLVMFTGDMVNNYSEEAHGWENLFAELRARYGRFSILGNHDYGEYWTWKSDAERRNNLMMLFKVHEDMGFELLRNAWDTVRINGSTLGIIGVENWGQPPFKQYGDLDKAMDGLPETGFNILLSHDPSHWDAKVLNKTTIPLTLSGHTHAMQFGVRLGKFRWSPSKYIYSRWNGLYRENGQALYVNRGLGFLGFPGRIGLRPEITLITLRSVKQD